MTFAGIDRRGEVLTAVGLLTLLAALVRFSTLDRQSFWSDEAMTVLLTRMSFGDMLATIGDTESTPPLYYVVAWGWSKVLGSGEIGLRSLSALAGTAAVPVTYLAGSKLLRRRAGLVAAGFVAVSPLLVWYSQEARSYALAVLCCGVSFAALTYVVDRATDRALGLWAVASLLAVATHYFALFVVAVEVLWLLAAVRRPAARSMAAIVAFCAAGASLLALDQRSNRLVEVIARSDGLPERVLVLLKQLLVGGAPIPADRALGAGLALLVAASALLVVTRGRMRERRALLMAASIGGAAVVLPIAVAAVGFDYVNTRNAHIGMIPLAVAMAGGLGVAAPRRSAVALSLAAGCVLLAITVAVAVDPAYHRSNWRGLASAVSVGDHARVLVVAPDHQGWFARVPLQVYLPEARAIDDGRVVELPEFERVSRRAVDRATPEKVAVREVVLAGVGWEQPVLRRELVRSFERVEERDEHGYRFVRLRSGRPVTLPTAALVASLSATLEQR